MRLCESEGLGRSVVASRNLEAGERVFEEEEPFGQTVHDSCVETTCHACFRPLPSQNADGPLGCAQCGAVRYCSPACAAALASAHAYECDLLCDLGTHGSATLRLFVRMLHRARDDPSAFAEVERMVEHYDDASDERRKSLDQTAEGILQMVRISARLEVTRVARLVDRVHTNAFAVSDPAGVTYGTGLYVRAGSYFNHSCAPSAVVSFHGRTLRVHVTRPVRAGEPITIAYTDLYAGRSARQRALQTRKGFACACERCTRPPASDDALDGWKCASCERGCVAAGADRCGTCNAEHALARDARAAVESRWREGVEERWGMLVEGTHAEPLAVVARALLPLLESFLVASAGRLSETHELRHKAHVLVSYCLDGLEAPAAKRVAALEACVACMRAHLPPSHPNLCSFQYRLGRRLEQHVSSVPASKKAAVRKRAHEARCQAIQGLTLAYGADHLVVRRWAQGVQACP